MGERRENLSRAVEALRKLGEVVRLSSVYETPPEGPDGQRKFLNAVALFETELEPVALLTSLKGLEEGLGRTPGPRWGPRVIDVDILDYKGLQYQSEDLILPHPELSKRGFVLVPLAEIAPDWRHPVIGEPIRVLVEKLRESGKDLNYKVMGPLE